VRVGVVGAEAERQHRRLVALGERDGLQAAEQSEELVEDLPLVVDLLNTRAPREC
jgi:hypothetical protein